MTPGRDVEAKETTPAEFRALLDEAGLSQSRLALLLGTDVRTVNRWATGAKGRPVPRYAVSYLTLWIACERAPQH